MSLENAHFREESGRREIREKKARRIERKIKKIAMWSLIVGESFSGVVATWNVYRHERGKTAQIVADLQEVRKESDERSEIDRILATKYHRLLERYNERDIEDDLIWAEQLDEKRNEEHGREQKPMEIDPIETKNGTFRPQEIEAALANLPPSWVNGRIESIRSTNDLREEGKYGLARSEMLADYGPDDANAEGRIRFFDTARDERPAFIVEAIDHEVSHGNDWRIKPGLSLGERIAFLAKVSDRSFAADRFHSDYVEHINDKDLGERNYDKAIEYWAEICQAYFNDPQNLNIKDFMLVNDAILETDPSYDPMKAAATNHAIVELVRRSNPAHSIQ